MIRGVIYLTGLVTLTVVGLVAAFAFEVHKWPWKQYVESGRREVARKLDPAGPGASLPETGARGETQDLPRGPTPEERVRHQPRAPLCPGHVPSPTGPRRPGHVADPTGPRLPEASVRRVVRRHVVGRNETLYAIAQRYYGAGERWREIARANGIRKPSDLRVGRVIAIPCDAPPYEYRRPGGDGAVAYEDPTGAIWAPGLRLQFAPAVEARDMARDMRDGPASAERARGAR